MMLWFARRAVSWPPMLGSLVAAAGVVALTHRWESLSVLTLPLTAVLVAASAAFVYDDPAVAAAAVTPRGSVWALAVRSACGIVTLATGLVLLLGAPGDQDTGGWALVLGGLGGGVLGLTLAGSRRQVALPGTVIAPVVVLAGLAPLVVVLFADVRSPYPLPALDGPLRIFWSTLAVASATLAAIALHRGRSLRFGSVVPGARDTRPATIAGTPPEAGARR
ncbi:hypothetical protein FHP29_21220 [Nocardioides albidus]|uniref:Uncharacterized protein n=1 Tax=Nocardioides albidus TaxID=1517589 RepID=A0A5C4VM65_9ACTN|nr:hypothetical protein [Nocardioides albidus]TNM36645.1 hypothetical protein FHP29_21220 [Nocardioides albidus]